MRRNPCWICRYSSMTMNLWPPDFSAKLSGQFRDLLDRDTEEPVLKEEREGIDQSWPPCLQSNNR